MSDRPTTARQVFAKARTQVMVDAQRNGISVAEPVDLDGVYLAALRAAAGCGPGQPLVILDNGELTTAEASDCYVAPNGDKWCSQVSVDPIDNLSPLFRIPGAEEAPK